MSKKTRIYYKAWLINDNEKETDNQFDECPNDQLEIIKIEILLDDQEGF